jgi:hypothetical protein
MKIVKLFASPKKHKKLTNYGYVTNLTSIPLLGKKTKSFSIVFKSEFLLALEECKNADVIIFSTPVYVDSLPSHLIEFLELASKEIADKKWHAKIYVVSTCGFFEGKQCNLALEQIKLWSECNNLKYCGGLGVGGSEMLGIIRFTNLLLPILIVLIQLIVGIIQIYGFSMAVSSVFIVTNFINLFVSVGLFLLFSMGLFIKSINFGFIIRKQKIVKNRFTTVWFCGKYLFIFFASLFWIIRALFHTVLISKMFKK